MRELTYFTAVTLDGFVAGPLGGDRPTSAVLMGRKTWQVGMDLGTANPYPRLRSYVFSRSRTNGPDPAVEFVTGDPLQKTRELKQEDGLGIWLCGGGGLAQALWPEIDRLVVKVNPVVIGAGVKLFDGGDFELRKLELVDHRIYRSGVAVLTYKPFASKANGTHS